MISDNNGLSSDNGKHSTKNYSAVFEFLGIGFSGTSGEEREGICPFCLEEPFHVNDPTGLWQCKRCDESGNLESFLTMFHGLCLEHTPKELCAELRKKRGGIAPQTLERHGVAWNPLIQRWMIPFKNTKGTVVNLKLYDHRTTSKPNKWNLPGLETRLYGFDELMNPKNAGKRVFVCEGEFDAIALDYAIPSKHRDRYVVVATPVGMKSEWVPFFKGRDVVLLYDNDESGRKHRDKARTLLTATRTVSKLRSLVWDEGTQDKYDINDWVRDLGVRGRGGIVEQINARSEEFARTPVLKLTRVSDYKADEQKKIDWIWPNCLRCGSLCSLAGAKGTLKSTLVRELIAKYTKGEPMPFCREASMPAGTVLYITAEDEKDDVMPLFHTLEANTNRIFVQDLNLQNTEEDLNLLNSDVLLALEEVIRDEGIRWVVIDGQNSCVGSVDYSSDSRARHNYINKLHRFAQKLNICLLGLRNANDTGRAMGCQANGDMARCVHGIEVVDRERDVYRWVSERVSNAERKLWPNFLYSVKAHPFIEWDFETKHADWVQQFRQAKEQKQREQG